MKMTGKCSGILRKSHKWANKGGKEGSFFCQTNPRCSSCDGQDLDECMKATFKEAFPSQDYNAVNVYINLKPKAEVIDQTPKPEQENAQEINKEETEAPAISEA